jgi:hypothetical protein
MKQKINYFLQKIIQIFVLGSLAISVLVAIALAWLWPRYEYLPAEPVEFSLQRFTDGPIVDISLSERLTSLAEREGYININGPSIIAVPEWVENPLGKYYLYFSHHRGDSIRLAYADQIEGPWEIYEPGALSLSASGFPSDSIPSLTLQQGIEELWDSSSIYLFRDTLLAIYQSLSSDQPLRRARGLKPAQPLKAHIASPEVVVDNDNKQLLMFFHGQRDSLSQVSGIALSTDGLNYKAMDKKIAGVYLRSFEYQQDFYFLATPGVLYRSDSLLGDYMPRRKSLFATDIRHSAVSLEGDKLTIVFSRAGDTPERLLLSTVDLSKEDWNDWAPTQAVEILRAEKNWEGADLSALKSLRGETTERSNDLRDPDLFVDTDGQQYLLYVGGGEQGIGIVRFSTDPQL